MAPFGRGVSKPSQKGNKRNFRSKIFAEKIIPAAKNETSGIVRNAFWQSFAPIGALIETKTAVRNHRSSYGF